MFLVWKGLGKWMLLTGVLLGGVRAAPAQTSTTFNPALHPRDAQGRFIQTNTSFNPYNSLVTTYPSPYWGYAYNPYEGYLRGGADVIRAQGQFMINRVQANLLREQVKVAKIETRRKGIEQWLWERENLPTPQDERERLQKEEIRRSRNDPPITEIWSAKALNDLLLDAQRIQSTSSVRAGVTPLSEEMLAKINVTTGRSGGNIGLLRGGKVRWPLLLYRPAFEQQRVRLDGLVTLAVEQASRGGDVDPGTLEEIIRRVTELQRYLVEQARKSGDDATWTPTMYRNAKTFLSDFDNALKVLQEPNAGRYLTGKYAAKGKTVSELVQYMKENGLHFAPAMPGGEGEYVALYNALRDYDVEGGAQLRPAR